MYFSGKKQSKLNKIVIKKKRYKKHPETNEHFLPSHEKQPPDLCKVKKIVQISEQQSGNIQTNNIPDSWYYNPQKANKLWDDLENQNTGILDKNSLDKEENNFFNIDRSTNKIQQIIHNFEVSDQKFLLSLMDILENEKSLDCQDVIIEAQIQLQQMISDHSKNSEDQIGMINSLRDWFYQIQKNSENDSDLKIQEFDTSKLAELINNYFKANELQKSKVTSIHQSIITNYEKRLRECFAQIDIKNNEISRLNKIIELQTTEKRINSSKTKKSNSNNENKSKKKTKNKTSQNENENLDKSKEDKNYIEHISLLNEHLDYVRKELTKCRNELNIEKEINKKNISILESARKEITFLKQRVKDENEKYEILKSIKLKQNNSIKNETETTKNENNDKIKEEKNENNKEEILEKQIKQLKEEYSEQTKKLRKVYEDQIEQQTNYIKNLQKKNIEDIQESLKNQKNELENIKAKEILKILDENDKITSQLENDLTEKIKNLENNLRNVIKERDLYKELTDPIDTINVKLQNINENENNFDEKFKNAKKGIKMKYIIMLNQQKEELTNLYNWKINNKLKEIKSNIKNNILDLKKSNITNKINKIIDENIKIDDFIDDNQKIDEMDDELIKLKSENIFMRSTFNNICSSNDDDLIQPLKLSINEQVNKIVQLSEEKKKLEKINKNLNSEINKLKASNENNGTFSPPTLPSSSRKYYNAIKSNQNDTDETHSEENVQSNEIEIKT